VRTLSGRESQELLFPFLDPRLSIFAEIELVDAELMPAEGPLIIAANHRSYFDPFALAYLAADRSRPVRFMAKKEVLDIPIIGAVVAALGTIPVDRGSVSSAPLNAAATALQGGEAVVILPQGTIPRGDDFFKAKLRGHSGAVRLAQRTGAPILPVGIWGSEAVWPRNSRLPHIAAPTNRPPVRVRVGEPYHVTKRSKPKPATEKLMKRIVSLLPAEAQHDQDATDEQLAASRPRP
jgi:putative phosphoserine phosphatase/1-acylglycerol-3-phosphate O-acyltransferase